MIKEDKFETYKKKPVLVGAYQTDEEFEIETLEGTMKASKGDYIIKGVQGEYYPCKPDVFEMTYDKVDFEETPAKTIDDYFNEWEDLLKTIDEKSEDLYVLKNSLIRAEQEIIDNTDFKALFGKNNADVRKAYLKDKLQPNYDAKHELEMSIDSAKRRIDYIRSLMNMQRALIDMGVIE